MPFDGSGNFNRVMDWTNDAAAAIKIRADRHDQNDDDIAAGLSNTITKDGQTQPTANIPMNGKKLINLGAPTNPTDAASKTYVDTADALKAPLASPTFTGKVTLPTGVAGTPPVNFPNATAAPTTPANGDIWPDPGNAGLKHRINGVTYTYGRLEAAQTWTAAQTFNSLMNITPSTVGAIGQSGGNTGTALVVNSPTNAGAAAFVSFNRLAAFAVNFGLDTDNILKVGGWSMGANAYRIMHEGLASGTFTGAYTWSGAQAFNGDITLTSAGAMMSVFANDGNRAGTTYTPTAADGNIRSAGNNGAFTMSADLDNSKAYTLVVFITNAASGAGAITLTNWSWITGDSFNTTANAIFMCTIVHMGGYRLLNIQAM